MKVTQKYDIRTFCGVASLPKNSKKINKQEQWALLHTVHSNRHATHSDITNILPTKITVDTLKRHLNEVGMQKNIAVKKLYLSRTYSSTIEVCIEA